MLNATWWRGCRSPRACAQSAHLEVALEGKALALADLTDHRGSEQTERVLDASDDRVLQRIRHLAAIERHARHVEMLLLVRALGRAAFGLCMFGPPAECRRPAIQLGMALYAGKHRRRNHRVDGHLDRALGCKMLPIVDVNVGGRHEQ